MENNYFQRKLVKRALLYIFANLLMSGLIEDGWIFKSAFTHSRSQQCGDVITHFVASGTLYYTLLIENQKNQMMSVLL